MENIGITRRIDELGRIVIPKEIRKNLKIKSSDELEIKVIDNKVILSKYDGLEQEKIVNELLVSINKETGKNVLYTSKERIVDKVLNDYKNIESDLDINIYKKINNREKIESLKSKIKLFKEEEILSLILYPIIINGDLIGSIILYSDKDIDLSDRIIMGFSKRFLELYLE